MAYQDLNADSVKTYLLENTHLFSKNARLQVYEIGDGEDDGDGYVNFLYRVWDEKGKSVIVKQAKTYYRAFEEGVGPFVRERNLLEAKNMGIRYAINPRWIPKIYHIDRDNHLYVCEDKKDYKVLRFELMRGMPLPHIAKQLGTFLARNHFYTSEYYLDATVFKEMQSTFMNPHMRLVFEYALFLPESAIDTGNERFLDSDPQRVAMGQAPWQNEALRVELLKLRQLHMHCAQCLVHGDLHTSNVLVSEDNRMAVIDMEYAYMGPFSSDMGYLIGSYFYEYLRWFYLEASYGKEFCARYREKVLADIRSIIDTYSDVFCEVWDRDAKSMYRKHTGLRDWVMTNYMSEMVGYIGYQILSRVGGLVPLPDFDTLPDQADRLDASRLALNTAYYLILHREEIGSSKQLTDVFERMAQQYRQVKKVVMG